MKYISRSLDDTKEIAKKFSAKLKAGDVVVLNGDLGAGKTTFTKCVFACLGVKDVVNSPTFAILKTYEGKFRLHHFDTYRITTKEAIEAGFDEIFDDEDSVIFIEWAENIAELLPKKVKTINIKFIDKGTREFEIK